MQWFARLIVLVNVLLCCSCEYGAIENEPFENVKSPLLEANLMTMSAVTAADHGGSVPVTSIMCPDAGEEVKAEDIRAPVAALLAEADDIRNNATTGLANKVDRTGDTMTGGLTITPTNLETALDLNAAPNQVALAVQGSGAATAVEIVAGTEAAITAIASTALPAATIANDDGPAMTLIGSTSTIIPALGVATATAQSAAVARMAISSNGFLAMIGTDPNPSTDPGEDNALHGANIPKTWARIASRVGDTDASRIKAGYNIASVTTTAFTCEVSFVRPMTGEYAVVFSIMGGAPYAIFRSVSETSTGFIITGKYVPSDTDVQIQTAGQFDIGFVVHARQ